MNICLTPFDGKVQTIHVKLQRCFCYSYREVWLQDVLIDVLTPCDLTLYFRFCNQTLLHNVYRYQEDVVKLSSTLPLVFLREKCVEWICSTPTVQHAAFFFSFYFTQYIVEQRVSCKMNVVVSDSGAVLHLFCACTVRLQCQHPEVFQRNTAKCTVFLFVSKRIF